MTDQDENKMGFACALKSPQSLTMKRKRELRRKLTFR